DQQVYGTFTSIDLHPSSAFAYGEYILSSADTIDSPL
ncbi:unnamed protein product, partial [marine sediment metagenome]